MENWNLDFGVVKSPTRSGLEAEMGKNLRNFPPALGILEHFYILN
jgi:hypothetical protein